LPQHHQGCGVVEVLLVVLVLVVLVLVPVQAAMQSEYVG
jgi:competence protein ComGC